MASSMLGQSVGFPVGSNKKGEPPLPGLLRRSGRAATGAPCDPSAKVLSPLDLRYRNTP